MNQKKSIRILSNFKRLSSFSERFSTQKGIQIAIEPLPSKSKPLWALRTFSKALNCELLILNIEGPLLFKLCFLKYLFPGNRCHIISVDLIMRAPRTLLQRVLCRLKGLLLKKVHCFILYHKDVSGYQRYFGIDSQRCLYVPFKANQLEEIKDYVRNLSEYRDPTDGDYVMAVGRSLRDYSTFVKAMAKTKLPGVLLRQDKSILAQNATVLEYGSLPPNIKEVVDHGPHSSFLENISKAKVIVIPRFCRDINATGIASYLQAMAMRKCVIISHGPGTTELLLNDEAILVPPEDADALSVAIEKAWNDPVYRMNIASNGQKYAFFLKDEDRLLYDILTVSCQMLKNSQTTHKS